MVPITRSGFGVGNRNTILKINCDLRGWNRPLAILVLYNPLSLKNWLKESSSVRKPSQVCYRIGDPAFMHEFRILGAEWFRSCTSNSP